MAERGFRTVRQIDVTPVLTAIERARLRLLGMPSGNRVREARMRRPRPLPKWLTEALGVIGAAVFVGSMLFVAIGFSG